VVTVGSEWSSSLRLSVHIFFSQWSVLQLLTLLLSLRLLDSLVNTLPPLSLASSLVDALLLRVVAGPPMDALPQWASSLLPRRMLGHRWNPWQMLCHRCLFGPSLVDALMLGAYWPSLGGYLVAVVAWSSLADVLPLVARLSL
jgi:hypothetical protein